MILQSCQLVKLIFGLVLITVVVGCQSTENILVFSKTNGFRHGSIPAGISAINNMAQDAHWQMTFSEDSTLFNQAELHKYDLVIFLNTTGDILGPDEEAAFKSYLQNGGRFMGIHSASDTENNWLWYGQMLGARFASHPPVQSAEINVHHEDAHPCISHLPEKWTRTDEYYNFKEPLVNYANVLLDLNESTIEGIKMNTYHPLAWHHKFQGAKVFYTALGHTKEAYEEKAFVLHLEQAIQWLLR